MPNKNIVDETVKFEQSTVSLNPNFRRWPDDKNTESEIQTPVGPLEKLALPHNIRVYYVRASPYKKYPLEMIRRLETTSFAIVARK